MSRRAHIYGTVLGIADVFILAFLVSILGKEMVPWLGDSYWEGLFGNLFASLIAVFVGIPIALKLEAKRKEKETDEMDTKEREKEGNLLLLVKEELEFNHRLLAPRASNRTVFPSDPLKHALWDAFESSGSIRVIENPELLNRIVSVYHHIRNVVAIERVAYEQKWPGGLIDARKFDSLLESSIVEALKMIDVRIEELGKLTFGPSAQQ